MFSPETRFIQSMHADQAHSYYINTHGFKLPTSDSGACLSKKLKKNRIRKFPGAIMDIGLIDRSHPLENVYLV